MEYIGDISEDQTVNVYFTTNDGSGGAVAPSTAFEAADIAIYKDNSATQKATANGLTMTSPFDAVVGLHLITIDTSNDTGDAGFWATGSDYTVILNPDETVDSQTVVSVLAQFSIQNRYMRGTDSAALASVATEARLAELDAANLPADLDAVLLDTGTTIPAQITALNNLSAAAVNAEVDTALSDYDAPTRAELTTDINSVLTRLGTPAGLDVSADVAAVKAETALIVADTNELQTDDVPGLIAALNNITVADILSGVIETGYDVKAVLQIIAAATGGKLSGAATVTNVIRSLDDSRDVITATVDSDGNRSAVTHSTT